MTSATAVFVLLRALIFPYDDLDFLPLRITWVVMRMRSDPGSCEAEMLYFFERFSSSTLRGTSKTSLRECAPSPCSHRCLIAAGISHHQPRPCRQQGQWAPSHLGCTGYLASALRSLTRETPERTAASGVESRICRAPLNHPDKADAFARVVRISRCWSPSSPTAAGSGRIDASIPRSGRVCASQRMPVPIGNSVECVSHHGTIGLGSHYLPAWVGMACEPRRLWARLAEGQWV